VERRIDALHAGMMFGAAERAAIARMRRSMEPENRFRRNDFIDIKKSAGGLIDAEFAVQVAQLASGKGRAYRVEDEADEALARRLRDMIACHAWLRVLQLRLRVLLDTPSDLVPREEEQRRVLARSLGMEHGDALLDELRTRMAEMRRGMVEVLG
jgi:glutamine synthetase adenylyltransferase